MLGYNPYIGARPRRAEGGGASGACLRVEVYHTQYGDVTQVVIPPTIYETL